MRLLDLAVVYLVAGTGCAWALRSRRVAPATATRDALLALLLWPVYVPLLLGGDAPREGRAPSPRAPTPHVVREQELLREALVATRRSHAHASVASLLPSDEALARVVGQLERLDAKVQELDAVLGSDDFDPARAERRLREARGTDRGAAATAAATLEGARRLHAMRERAARERDELLGLCARLRMHVTVLRFADAPGGDDLGELVHALMARVEAAGEALTP